MNIQKLAQVERVLRKALLCEEKGWDEAIKDATGYSVQECDATTTGDVIQPGSKKLTAKS